MSEQVPDIRFLLDMVKDFLAEDEEIFEAPDYGSSAQVASTGRPAWALPGTDYTIQRQDISDSNFIRKRLWELSGDKPKSEITMWAFDGRNLKSLTLLASTAIIRQLATAIYMHFGKPTAVFMSGPARKMLLLSHEGQLLTKPEPLSHQSFNGNPANDWDFIAALPRKIAEIVNQDKKQAARKPTNNWKAWVNVDTKDIRPFPFKETFFVPLAAEPSVFGVTGKPSKLEARIMAERNGWCAVGLNDTPDHGLNAIVQSMNAEHAWKATKILFNARYRAAPWATLVVNTNDQLITFRGRDEIIRYVEDGALDKVHFV